MMVSALSPWLNVFRISYCLFEMVYASDYFDGDL
jgi:hypothetical protein